MDRTQKATFVSDLNARVANAGTMVVSHYRGLTVKQMQTLRAKLREQGGEAQVTKNRLAKLAFKDTKFDGVADLMKGPTLITFSEDVVAAAKITHAFAGDNDKLVIVGGMMDGKMMDVAAVKALALLPSLNESRAKLVGILQAPGAQIARVLKAYSEKGPKAAEAATAAPAAEAAPAAAPEAAPAPAEAAPEAAPAATETPTA